MKPLIAMTTLPLVLGAGFALATPAHAEDGHAHQAATQGRQHHAGGAAAVADNGAERWPTDAPLREGMRQIRTAVNALEHHEHGHLDATQATRLASDVEAGASYLFANCKLDPEPDAALHVLLAKLLNGAQAIKVDPADTRVVAPMREALGDYPRLFDDPQWATEAEGDEEG